MTRARMPMMTTSVVARAARRRSVMSWRCTSWRRSLSTAVEPPLVCTGTVAMVESLSLGEFEDHDADVEAGHRTDAPRLRCANGRRMADDMFEPIRELDYELVLGGYTACLGRLRGWEVVPGGVQDVHLPVHFIDIVLLHEFLQGQVDVLAHAGLELLIVVLGELLFHDL